MFKNLILTHSKFCKDIWGTAQLIPLKSAEKFEQLTTILKQEKEITHLSESKEPLLYQARQAFFSIGEMYLKEIRKNPYFDSPHYGMAIKYYQEAANRQFFPALLRLAIMHAEGRGMPRNEQEAASLRQKVGISTHAEALYNLGCMFSDAQELEPNSAEAVALWEKAAAYGHAEAQNNLAVMYKQGKGVAQDVARAREWYRKAAAQGHANAQYNLGVMFYQGQGLGGPDISQAVYWWTKAAAQGHRESQYHLGCYYAKNPAETAIAISYFSAAALQGDVRAQYNAGCLYEREKDYSHAFYYYNLAANQNYAAAQNSLGWMQEKGLNGTKDEVAAFNWYRSSALQGHAFAILNFAHCLEQGIGTQADKMQAHALYATIDNATLTKWRTARGLN